MSKFSSKQTNEITTYFNRVRDGKAVKKSSDKDKEEAAKALSLFKSLEEGHKMTFWQKWKDNKKQPGWAWTKQFTDTLSKKTETSESVTAGYMTRSVGWAYGGQE
jgi:hypothetical protein